MQTTYTATINNNNSDHDNNDNNSNNSKTISGLHLMGGVSNLTAHKMMNHRRQKGSPA